MKYKCQKGHVANDPDYCRACLAEAYAVSPWLQEESPAPAPYVEEKPEELTPVITPVVEGEALPVAKHHGRKR